MSPIAANLQKPPIPTPSASFASLVSGTLSKPALKSTVVPQASPIAAPDKQAILDKKATAEIPESAESYGQFIDRIEGESTSRLSSQGIDPLVAQFLVWEQGRRTSTADLQNELDIWRVDSFDELPDEARKGLEGTWRLGLQRAVELYDGSAVDYPEEFLKSLATQDGWSDAALEKSFGDAT